MNNSKRYGSITAALLCLALTGIHTASAQSTEEPSSAFGCRNLETISELQMIEGKDGMFFRILADLRLQHAFTDQTVDNIAAMAKALEKKGTTLIYMPLPTKSQVLPDLVPAKAALYGYDAGIAVQIYNDVVRRLNDKGVAAVDIATPMRQKETNEFGEYAFFKSDFHWTAHGASIAAQAVANVIKSLPAYSDVSPVRFDMQEVVPETESSSMRELLQKHCVSNLPAVAAHSYRAVRVDEETTQEGSALDIFGGGDSASIALIGTSYSDKAVSNFAGFLEHSAEIPVENYSISGGNQFGSILSFVTSREFQQQRPRFLIWENPIYNNLGQFGRAPWMEILAASLDECSAPLTVIPVDGAAVEANLSGIKLTADDVLRVDFGEDLGRKATFTLTDGAGQLHTRSIERGDRLRSTGRFFFSLADFPNKDFSKVTVSFDLPAGGGTSLSICKTKPGEDS
jgi:alginate biosynthesis protein AlgX